MSNYPDNIRDFDNHPMSPFYNEPDDVYICWNCSEVTDEDELEEVETPKNGTQLICEDCIEDYKEQ